MPKHLTKEQIKKYGNIIINTPTEDSTPVRFLNDLGENVNLINGETMPRGTNVIHQRVYWNFREETAKEIAEILELKVVFSE